MKHFRSTFMVAPSEIHGKGCYTTIDLEPGMRFPVPYEPIEESEVDDHSVFLNGRWHQVFGPFQFINHKRKPTVTLEWDDAWGVVLVVERWVIAGKEVTMDYGDGW